MGMYYNFRKINGYNLPIRMILSRRGLGKTFGAKLPSFREFLKNGKRMIYVVETLEMVKTVSQNNGEKFFGGILDFLHRSPSKRNQKLYDKLVTGKVDQDEDIKELDFVDDKGVKYNVKGGTIHMDGQTMGYILALNDFANVKRNDFVNIGTIIIDEFIPESTDIRTLKNPYKLNSILQSVLRTRSDVVIYLLANTINLADPILQSFVKGGIEKGEYKVIWNKSHTKRIGVCHLVDNDEYPEFDKVANNSLAGMIAELLEVDNLERNDFANAMDKSLKIPQKPEQSHFVFCIHGECGSLRFHVTKNYQTYYCMDDYGSNRTQRYCLDKKYSTAVVSHTPEYKDMLITMYTTNRIKFDTDLSFVKFKSLVGLV